MATIGQIYYNVLDTNSGSYISSSGINIFEDIIPNYNGAEQFIKVGIQAPPGTKVVMNEVKTIMIGRTGMYELDDDIAIRHMYFIRPYKYVYDADTSQALIEQGIKDMNKADADRSTAMQALRNEYPGGIPSQSTDPTGFKNYWTKYNQIQSDYIVAYEAGLDEYTRGINGVYTLPNPSDPDDENNYQDLLNVIVDFIYE